MKDKNNEHIVFEMLEEVATESIAEASYTYDEIADCYVEAKKIAEVAKTELENYINNKPQKNSHRSGSIGFTPSAITALL